MQYWGIKLGPPCASDGPYLFFPTLPCHIFSVMSSSTLGNKKKWISEKLPGSIPVLKRLRRMGTRSSLKV